MPVTRNEKAVSDQLLNALLADFERGTSVTDAGIQFIELGYDETFEILPDAFRFNPKVGRRTSIGIARQALLKCRRAGAVDIPALLQAMNEIEHQHRAVPDHNFTIWTKFRATNMAYHRGFRVVWDGVTIKSLATLPKSLSLEEYFFNGVGRIYPRQPYEYGHVVMTCKAGNERAAMERCLEALQIVMALANLVEGKGRWSHGDGKYWTEGKLSLGPHQFVFRDGKFLGDERVWYNQEYEEGAWKFHPLSMRDVLRVMPIVRRALKEISEHPLKLVLVRSLLLLQDGFCSRDGSHRLLRYWSALESLYRENGERSTSHQKVVDRAAFAENDKRLVKWKLNHAANLRHEHAHAGGSDDNLQVIGQFLRHLIVRHLNYWIFTGKSFENHSQLLAYVDLPSDPSQLEVRSAAIARRLALIEESRRDDASG